MAQRTVRTSPQHYARLCGVLYLYIIAAGMFAELFVRSRLILAFDVVVAVILYALLRPVDRNIALLAAFMRFACDIVLAVASLSHFAALKLFADADYLKTFTPDQLHTLALLALKIHGDGYAISLVFFGFACLSLGYLILKSRFLPRTIGALMAIAGACYLINSFSHFLSPAFAATLFPGLFVPIFVAELSLALWLTVKGVNVAKWEEQASVPAR